MALQLINLGNQPNDGLGDGARTGGAKINANFTEVYELTFSINSGRWRVMRYKVTGSNISALRVDDIVEGWADETQKDRWVKGVVLDANLTLPDDIDDNSKFFLITDRQR